MVSSRVAESHCVPLRPGQKVSVREAWDGAGSSGTSWDPIVGMELGSSARLQILPEGFPDDLR